MAHGYHALQRFNQWLSQNQLGERLKETEEKTFSTLLQQHFGKHALLIGVSNQINLLNATKIPYHTLISPLFNQNHPQKHYIESDFHELPILTGSIDLVILPHILEFVDNPRQLLAESCRIVKPEGLIVLSGFNPESTWGMKKFFSTRKKTFPWGTNFIRSQKIKNWLRLADFVLEKHVSVMFRPPLENFNIFKKLEFLERLGTLFFPLYGGVYVLIARAKVIPLTPIKMTWKQSLSSIPISTIASGHIARTLKRPS